MLLQKNIIKIIEQDLYRPLALILNFVGVLSGLYTENTVSLNQRNIFLIYGQRKNFIELKKVLLIQKNSQMKTVQEKYLT